MPLDPAAVGATGETVEVSWDLKWIYFWWFKSSYRK